MLVYTRPIFIKFGGLVWVDMRADIQKAWDESPEFKGAAYPGQGPGPDKILGLLNSSEQVKCILRCMIRQERGRGYISLKCTAVVTSENIYLVMEGIFAKRLGKSSEVVPLRHITGITLKRQLGSGTTMEISRAANVDFLFLCDADQAAKWASIVKELMNNPLTASGGNPISASVDPFEQLKKLKELLDAGAISFSEFEEKKRIIMEKI